ncbi:hypothetical protein B0H66DRAFT_239493 [Apodospora peruviana]|uniref:LysM domain-containing protein n=1 Tax=Apodospora peruviana TaxID=516989 RepID=A0AAE0I545_9PEZI|nr:hypothetical protein B0H66DRAFT_239493 [Apodospora peruviana]
MIPGAMIPSQRPSSTALRPAAQDPDSVSVRPRNRRLISTNDGQDTPAPSLSTPGPSPSRGASPIPAAHIGGVTGRNNSGTAFARSPARTKSPAAAGGLLGSSWAPSWASVTEFASSLLSGGESLYASESERPRSRNVNRTRSTKVRTGYTDAPMQANSWGPEPPVESRPRLNDVAAGSRAKREAALKAMKTASVLESYDGVNGGLDISGSYKRRNSDEDPRGSSQDQEVEEHLVYIHHVQPNDTYAGIVLKYRCREDAFRKANGLWSRDNIQIRKWLAIPVDACEVKGRPCQDPVSHSAKVDLLAQTPQDTDPFGNNSHGVGGDFFGSSTHGLSFDRPKTGDEERPWTHVRWVSLDSCPNPVEIARVPRKAFGYFPPRRKKSLLSGSLPSTPRGSMDVPSITLSGGPALESSGSTPSRRPSLLSNRPQPSSAYSVVTQTSGRSRVSSAGEDARPAWMRRPGGVGSLGKTARAPGPEKDYLNSWTKKHLPGLNIDSLPSMSVMGAEIAKFGFGASADEQATIVESPFEDGRDTSSASQQGSGLDKAAAAIETWLRGAFAKHPGTPVLGPRGRSAAVEEGDLIELADTNSDDGRGLPDGGFLGESSLLGSAALGSSSRSAGDGAGTVRGRSCGGNVAAGKNRKDD